MDGYTSSGSSYGGGVAAFAFEGAVSEAGSADLPPTRYLLAGSVWVKVKA